MITTEFVLSSAPPGLQLAPFHVFVAPKQVMNAPAGPKRNLSVRPVKLPVNVTWLPKAPIDNVEVSEILPPTSLATSKEDLDHPVADSQPAISASVK